jgi:CheY-like chemotaxis protein
MLSKYLALSERRPPKPPADGGESPRLLKHGQPITVLILEDEPLVAATLSEAIEEHGGRVVGIVDLPADAFGLVVERRPDVVLIDVTLRYGRDGIRAAEAIRALHGTPVVFCTGAGDAQTVDRIRAFGGELLLKPVRAKELAEAILRACTR